MDYCLQNATQEEFDTLMVSTGLGVEVADEEGNTSVQPSSYQVLFDRIGPITINDGVDKKGKALTTTFPEYHTNLRVTYPLTEEQDTALAPFTLNPANPHYRVWAP